MIEAALFAFAAGSFHVVYTSWRSGVGSVIMFDPSKFGRAVRKPAYVASVAESILPGSADCSFAVPHNFTALSDDVLMFAFSFIFLLGVRLVPVIFRLIVTSRVAPGGHVFSYFEMGQGRLAVVVGFMLRYVCRSGWLIAQWCRFDFVGN